MYRPHSFATVLFGAAIGLGAAMPAQVQGRTDQPVVIGGDPLLDACGSIAEVVNLRDDGDGFLSVRAGPGTGYQRLDTLVNGDRVLVCTGRGRWLGVVYSKSGADCGVTTPWPEAVPYTGPCRSGWVHRNWLRIIAG